jgi:hypothetical protein
MGGRDRVDDRQAEAPAMSGPVGREPLEWLEQPRDLIGRNGRTRIRDPKRCTAVAFAHLELHTAARDVVAQRVLQQVRHEPLDQTWITGEAGRAQLGVDRDVPGQCLQLAPVDHGAREHREVDELAAVDPLEQPIDRVAEVLEFVLRSVDREAAVEACSGDLASRVGHCS